ncbi:terminase [Streptomyces chryseus]
MRKPAGSWRAADGPVYGHQRPRIMTVPDTGFSSAGQEAIDLAKRAGLTLDPWQQFLLDQGMREDPVGDWAAFEVCCNIPRQNGKGGVIEARELWGLFIGGERLILHSAHQFKTSKVAFRRIVALIKNCPDLDKRVKAYRYTTGEESIELHDGAILQFIARSGGSGRGFTGHCNIMDEAMYLGDDAMDALMPTMSAVTNPQLWYFGSAGVGSPSVQLARLRRRTLASLETGTPDPSLAYFEWSINPHVDECGPGCTEHDDVDSPQSALRANPGIGYRLTLAKIDKERASMSPEGYARERLGVGDYPSDSADTWQVIGEDAWRSLAAAESAPQGEVAFAIDMTPERSHAAIAVAGEWRGGTHVEVVDHRPGTGWLVDRAKALHTKWKPRVWVVDASGPAGSLIKELADALEVKIVTPTAREVAQATGQFYDAVTDQSLSHLDQAPLATALAGAQKRLLGDAWAWARRSVGVDISPLVAATHAKWGLGVDVEDDADPMDNIW